MLFIPRKIIHLPGHELDLNCDQSVEPVKELSPGVLAVQLCLLFSLLTCIWACLWFIKCPISPHPAMLHLCGLAGKSECIWHAVVETALWVFIVAALVRALALGSAKGYGTGSSGQGWTLQHFWIVSLLSMRQWVLGEDLTEKLLEHGEVFESSIVFHFCLETA